MKNERASFPEKMPFVRFRAQITVLFQSAPRLNGIDPPRGPNLRNLGVSQPF